MLYTNNDIVIRSRQVQDGIVDTKTASSILYKIIWFIIYDIITNDMVVRIPISYRSVYIGARVISENEWKSVYKGIYDDSIDWTVSMHKAFHICIKHHNFDKYSPIRLDSETFSIFSNNISSGKRYASKTKEKTLSKYVSLIKKLYDNLSFDILYKLCYSCIVSAYRLALDGNEVVISGIVKSKLFSISIGNNGIVCINDNFNELESIINEPDYNGIYYMPITKNDVMSMNVDGFNQKLNAFITTSIDMARIKSDIIAVIECKKNYGRSATLKSFRFYGLNIMVFDSVKNNIGFLNKYLIKYCDGTKGSFEYI